MNKSTSQLITLVKQEAKALRKKATLRERQKLNFSNLIPSSARYCVYGQMTGNCYSSRAHDLIRGCAKKSYIQKGTLANAVLNGKMNIADEEGEYRKHYSPIEVFIAKAENFSNGNTQMLLDYLQENRNTLIFKPF